MDAPAQAAVGRADHALRADDAGEPLEPLSDQLRMLHDIGGMGDDARDDHPVLGQLDVLPHGPLVLVAGVGGLEAVVPRVDLEEQADDVAQLNVGGVRPVPGAPSTGGSESARWARSPAPC